MKIKFIKINRKTKEMANILASLFIFVSLIFTTFSPLLVNKTEAAFNKQINYQGKLTTSAGVAVANGTYNMEFILYSVSTGGSSLWTETRTGANKVQVTNGLFSVLLGEVNALTGVDFNQTLYLGVNIGGTGTPGWDGEMTPRKKLGAVPAAVVSENANITNDATTSSAVYPTWVTTNSGGMPIKTSSAQLSFIPSSGSLTVSGYVYTPNVDAPSAVALNLGTVNQSALTLGRVGANTTINGAVVAINSNAASALNITTGTTGALTLDTGTTGTINIGTGTGGKTINIGTNNTTADTILIGSALDTIKISKFAVNGFLKTNSSDGTLSVDTNTYATTGSLGTYVPYSGATGNVTLGTYSLTTPNVIGGTTTTSPLTFQTTTGVGTTGADMHFKVGNAGATEAMTILNNGNVGIGTTAPTNAFTVYGQDNSLAFGGIGAIGSDLYKITAAYLGNTRRLNYGDMILSKNLSGVSGADTYKTVGTYTGSGYSGIEQRFGGDIFIYSNNGNTVADQVITPTTRMVIKGNTGNVGIGTTTPGAALDISSGNALVTRINGTATGGYLGFTQSGTARGYMGYLSGGGTLFSSGEIANGLGIRAETALQMGIGGNVSMTIANSGNVARVSLATAPYA